MRKGVYFPGVNALRGLAAVLVVAQHAGYWTSTTAHIPIDKLLKVPFGTIGVLMFFTISGFVIGLNRHLPTGQFVSRRLLRIYPGYWAALAIVAALMMSIGGSIEIRWFSLLLLPSTTYPDAAIPVWTLVFEVAFYAVAAAVFSLRLSDEKLTSVILVWALLIITMSPYVTGDRAAMPGALIYLAQNNLFFVGGLLCAIHFDTIERVPTNMLLAAAVIGTALLPIMPSLTHTTTVTLLAVVMMSIVLVATRFNQWSKPVRLLGDASYGLFLTHFAFQAVSAAHLGYLPAWSLFAALVAIGIVGGCVFGLMEFALHRALLRALLSRRPAPEALRAETAR
jgi:exopolysaccharide production protein ExoZ